MPGLSLTRLVRGFGLMVGASLVGQAIGFLVLAIAARRLGAANLGTWYLTVSIMAFFSLPVGLGMTTLGTRDIATDPQSGRRVVGEVVSIQTVLAVLMFLILLGTRGLLAGDNPLLRTLLVIGGTAIFTNALTLEWALLALGRAGWVAWWRLVGQIVYGVLGVALITSGAAGAERYGALNMLGLGVTALGSWLTVVLIVGTPLVTPSPRRLLQRIRSSLPFGVILTMVQVYWALGAVLLGLLGSTRAVGLYGVAQKLPQVIVTLSLLWISTMYPHSAALYRQDPARLARQMRLVLGLGLSVMLPLVLIAPFIGSPLIAALFGRDYGDAGTTFACLILVAAVTFVSVNYNNVLMAVGEERRFLRYAVAGAIAALAVNVVLIPILGPVGPALGTLVAESIVGWFSFRRLRGHLGPLFPAIADYRRLGLGAAACVAFLALSGALGWQERGVIGMCIYAMLSGLVTFRRWVPRLTIPRPS